MSPELTTKVRLVRCPKCRQLLAELPEILVYKCGGCGVTLQAKSRINGLRSKSASVNDTEAAQRIGLDHASEDRKTRSSDRNAALLESGECSSDQENEWDQLMSSEGLSSTSHQFSHEIGRLLGDLEVTKERLKGLDEEIVKLKDEHPHRISEGAHQMQGLEAQLDLERKHVSELEAQLEIK